MSVKLLIDMNLSPDWVSVLERHGWSAIHWSEVGDPRATDRTIWIGLWSTATLSLPTTLISARYWR
ncbi:MAG: DUF5615 family PIN-like protein [Blastocatellales bacterium]|nr:DUF5615 family PIN-like protein [Blastocatellales bacterium]